MTIIGVTGSIATGKTYVTDCFEQLDVKTWRADNAVHHILDRPEVVKQLHAMFPEIVKAEKVDRIALGNVVFASSEKLKRLEELIHPLVEADVVEFVNVQKATHDLLVLDIPLLLEKKLGYVCDLIVVTHCKEETQTKRALEREGMTKEKLQMILEKQMPQLEKRRYADYEIDTEQSFEEVFAEVERILCRIRQKG